MRDSCPDDETLLALLCNELPSAQADNLYEHLDWCDLCWARQREITGFNAATPRPSTRMECRGMQRPCPFVSCRHNLLIVDGPRSYSQWDPILRKHLVDPSCALDVVDAHPDGASMQVVSNAYVGYARPGSGTDKRVAEILQGGLGKMRARLNVVPGEEPGIEASQPLLQDESGVLPGGWMEFRQTPLRLRSGAREDEGR